MRCFLFAATFALSVRTTRGQHHSTSEDVDGMVKSYNARSNGDMRAAAGAGMSDKNVYVARYDKDGKDCSGDPVMSMGMDLPGDFNGARVRSCDDVVAANSESAAPFGVCHKQRKTTCSTGMGASLVVFLVMLFLAGAVIAALCFLTCALTLPLRAPHAH